jgi:hypothetical protein
VREGEAGFASVCRASMYLELNSRLWVPFWVPFWAPFWVPFWSPVLDLESAIPF